MTAPPDTRLLIVDPQNDFCDLPPGQAPDGCAPALPVPGAHQDMLRLADFIDRKRDDIGAIAITLDTHQRMDIAHPGFWRRGNGDTVPPFTEIHAAALESGQYAPARPQDRARALAYLRELEARGRYTLMVWPEHCIEGSWGHQVHAAVRDACARWSHASGQSPYRVVKGRNPWTEHYSAMQAEVPDPADPATQFNQPLADWAAQAGTLLIAGEAGSHCVGATLQHLLDHWPQGQARHVAVLDDCISAVSGFDAAWRDILSRAHGRGVHILQTH